MNAPSVDKTTEQLEMQGVAAVATGSAPYSCIDQPATIRTIKHECSSGSYRECIRQVNTLLDEGWLCVQGWHLRDGAHCIVLCLPNK
jgi:hypothetical protein